jgi:hypothetical protein
MATLRPLLVAASLLSLAPFAALSSCTQGASTPPPLDDAGPPDSPPPDATPPDAPPPKPTSVYDPEHVHEVVLTLPPAEWDALRFEHNDPASVLGGMCLTAPKDTPFVQHHAALTIDGQVFSDVAIRKKGFLGSQSVSRPSLKIRLDEYVPGARFFDADRLTLNNSKQDPSFLRTCLAFELFRRAGVPASRCSFAHVVVNGDDLGVYANVEPMEKEMLAQHFTDTSGNLYEGQFSDFREAWQDTYDKKTNEADPDRSDLAALSQALLAPDAELLGKVDALLDREAFLTYWAMEALVGSWDGYTNNQNNHYVYHDPTSGKLRFLPWSPDATFAPDPRGAEDAPSSLYAWGAVPNRLYQLPEIRTQYRARVLKLLDEVMKKELVLAELDRMQALIAPFVGEWDAGFLAEVDAIRAFVGARSEVVLAELGDGPLPWTSGLHGSPCVHPTGLVSGSFSTKMGTTAKNNPLVTGTGKLHLELEGMLQDSTAMGVAAGFDGPSVQIQTVSFLGNNQVRVTAILIDRTLFAPGKSVPFDWQQAFGVFGSVDLATEHFTMLGYLNEGSVELDAASLADGAPVSGTFSSNLLTLAP